MEFHGSKTEKNLLSAFTGESHARNKYTFYAKEAKKAGFVELSKIYEETADNEKEHGKIWFKYLHDGDISDTITNLKDCIENETYEHLTMYPTFAKEAEEEGFRDIAMHFKHVAEIEGMHQKRFQSLLNDIENKVTVVLDKELKNKKILIHPNRNTATISIFYEDLIKLIKSENHKIVEI